MEWFWVALAFLRQCREGKGTNLCMERWLETNVWPIVPPLKRNGVRLNGSIPILCREADSDSVLRRSWYRALWIHTQEHCNYREAIERPEKLKKGIISSPAWQNAASRRNSNGKYGNVFHAKSTFTSRFPCFWRNKNKSCEAGSVVQAKVLTKLDRIFSMKGCHKSRRTVVSRYIVTCNEISWLCLK